MQILDPSKYPPLPEALLEAGRTGDVLALLNFWIAIIGPMPADATAEHPSLYAATYVNDMLDFWASQIPTPEQWDAPRFERKQSPVAVTYFDKDVAGDA